MKKGKLYFYCKPDVLKLMQKLKVMFILMLLAIFTVQAGEQTSITGTVKDNSNQPLPGVTVLIKGTTQGTVTNADGVFTISNVPSNGTLVFSFVGMQTQEIQVGNQTTINVTLVSSSIGLDEVVAIGYGTQKKVNLTGAISVVSSEAIQDRPVASTQQALQGLVPNLTISVGSSGGEPGGEMNMNIRGIQSFGGSSAPYVLVDGIPMGINDIDPNDIESISVLKDAASSAIYGARASNGVILITTKTGKSNKSGANVSYSNNFAMTTPLNLPEMAETMNFALAMNDAAKNIGISPWYSEEVLGRLAQNIANPGSAPEMLGRPDGLTWNIGAMGLGAAANNDWYDIYFKDHGFRQKHNLSVSGASGNIDYYLSAGFYDEKGLFKEWEDTYKRYNFDSKISSQATSWLKISVLFKYNNDKQDFPWQQDGRGRIYDLITKIKPTMPMKYPGSDIWTQESQVETRRASRDVTIGRQMVLSPRITIEPVKNWVTNVDVNYILNNDRDTKDNVQNTKTATMAPWVRPNGDIAYSPTKESTSYNPTMYSNEYLSPTVYSSYFRNFGKHFASVMAGYQQEVYKYSNLLAQASYLLSDAVPSVSTAVGTKTVSDQIGHWSTQSFFGRLNYNFDEKYFLEANFRTDGSSRFEPGEQWGNFPSVSAGWVLTKENFFPLKDHIDFFKIRASYGSLGNQNVANYLYVPTMPVSQSMWLFGNNRLWTVGTPNLTSIDLTWEKVSTTDVGFDFRILNDRLSGAFDWYEALTTDLVGPGQAVPVVLGAPVPRTNSGEIRTRGWEVELSWKHKVRDFYYEIGGVLSDNQSEVTKYNNPTNVLNTSPGNTPNNYYVGQKLGDLWGYKTAGLFQTAEEVAGWANQQAVYAGTWRTGDVKYVDQNGDGFVNFGKNTVDDHGDMVVVGNQSPRYTYGFNFNAAWKGFDLGLFFQGIGKIDLWLSEADNGNYFRGNANGPLHATVLKEHMDYWRDDTSPLGANPNAYFAKPYSVFTGENNKNYQTPNDRYMQDGSYLRLKNLQLGYTIPKSVTQKVNIANVKIYLSGENLITFTDLMLFDPEQTARGGIGDAKIYPLAKLYSVGLNINF
jgi:TonB-linked SusC/RagA family outer membrane protein